MKVIEKGDGRKGWAKEFRCTGAGNGNGGCGALLLVEQNDLYITRHFDYGGGESVHVTFRCPLCYNETDVEIPNNIKRKLQAKGKNNVL
jgi:hypothetical protein